MSADGVAHRPAEGGSSLPVPETAADESCPAGGDLTPVLAVGSVAFDTIKNPFGEACRVVGGSATYFSVAASFFTDVRLVAVVGEDFAERGRDIFEGRRIDLAGLQAVPGETFRWKGEYGFDLNTRETIYTKLNVFEQFQPVIPDAYRSSPIVFLGNIHPRLQLDVLGQVEKPSLVAADTMNYWIEGTPTELREVLKRVDVLIINDSEARELSGQANLVKAARAIKAMGPNTVVIKRGEHGVLMTRPSEEFFAAPGHAARGGLRPDRSGGHVRRRFRRVASGVWADRRRRHGSGHHLRQHASVVRGRGFQPGPAAPADAGGD
jgi:sugar/nucleoside kinase (ribokinase family)